MNLSQKEKDLLKSEADRIDREDRNQHHAMEINFGRKFEYSSREIVTLLRRIADV
jgi:hypothetical protein